MGWQYTPVTPLLVVSLLLSLILAVFLLVAVDRDGRRRVVFGLVGMELGSAYWAIMSLLKLSRSELSVMIFAEQLQYLGGTVIIVSWFVFTFAYTNRDEWLEPRVVVAVAALPVLAALLSLTNGSHQLLWSNPRQVAVGSFTTLAVSREPAFFFFAIVNYVVIGAGVYALARLIVGSRRVYRGQAAALVGSAVVPTAANVVTVTGLGPWPGVDFSPVAFTVSGGLLVFAITRYELLDLEPVARRRVVERMRDGYVVLDEDERVVDLNPVAGDLLDVESDAAVGRPLPDLAPNVEGLVTDGGDSVQTEFAVEGDDRRYVQARLSPLAPDTDDGGRLLLLQDVTDRRRVERRYQRLVERASDVVFVLDAEGTITYASPAIENVLGAPPEHVVGDDALGFVHPEDRERLTDLFQQGVDDPEAAYRFEFRVQNERGEWCHLEGTGRNLFDDPFVEGIVVNARDITERKTRERELERQNERLERFASVVSHDLRNPLEVARGHLELARQEGHEESLDRVATAHERMETLIDDVLTLAREGRQVTTTERTDIERVAREAWDAVETTHGTLAVIDQPAVDADPDRLRRLLENLFRNAVEHGSTSPASQTRQDAVEHGSTGNRNTERSDDAVEHGSTSPKRAGDTVDSGSTGDAADEESERRTGRTADGIKITVGPIEPMYTGTRVGSEQPSGFYVEDDGPGLPDIEGDLFEFGTTTGDSGTGLGLAIVNDIAEAHGWTVEATESAAGGARFEFTGVEQY